MAEKRKAGKIAKFVGELGLQLFAQIPIVDKTMDMAQTGIARRKRLERLANGDIFKQDSVAGQMYIHNER